jgi:hypothetical protein
MSGCRKCNYTGPEGEDHYHIVVEHGRVTEVWFVSGSGYWDRELEKDEYFVEYPEESKKPRSRKQVKASRKPKAGKSAPADWLEPKLYTGKSMHEEELENAS